MRQIKCYIAQSLDGYIARPDGNLDWLYALPTPEGEDYGYAEFLEGIDVVVMGRSTYEEICGFGIPWPYGEMESFVFTSQPDYKVQTERTYVVSEVSQERIQRIKATSKKNIWIVGGGQLVKAFLEQDAIDEFILCTVPTLIGDGLRLFPQGIQESTWSLKHVKGYESGAVVSFLAKS